MCVACMLTVLYISTQKRRGWVSLNQLHTTLLHCCCRQSSAVLIYYKWQQHTTFVAVTELTTVWWLLCVTGPVSTEMVQCLWTDVWHYNMVHFLVCTASVQYHWTLSLFIIMKIWITHVWVLFHILLWKLFSLTGFCNSIIVLCVNLKPKRSQTWQLS